MKYNLLFAEDETDLGSVVKQYLELMDFEVDWHQSAARAVEAFRAHPLRYHIALLDVSLPDMDGFKLSQQLLKHHPDMSFLFLTARAEKKDKLNGLQLGADDYITKPFDIDELVLRIRNILRRHHTVSAAGSPSSYSVVKHDVKLHKETLELQVGDEKMVLTVREAELLEYLIENANRILKREDILVQLWGQNDYFLGRSLDVFISRLRKYLSKSTGVTIKNVYGVGFICAC